MNERALTKLLSNYTQYDLFLHSKFDEMKGHWTIRITKSPQSANTLVLSINMDINHYNQISENIEELRRGWVETAGSIDEHGAPNGYCLQQAITDKRTYNQEMIRICNVHNTDFMRTIRNGHSVSETIPDVDVAYRRNMKGESDALNHQSFCIDSIGTEVCDDAISYDASEKTFCVHISDPVRFLNPQPEHISNAMLRRNLLKACTSYGVEGRQDMFPASFAVNVLSLTGSENIGDVVTVRFRVIANDNGSIHIQPLSTTLSSINRPIRITREECERYLSNDNVGQCEQQCGEVTCSDCTCSHFQEMCRELMLFRNFRLPSHERYYRNDKFSKHEVSLFLASIVGLEIFLTSFV